MSDFQNQVEVFEQMTTRQQMSESYRSLLTIAKQLVNENQSLLDEAGLMRTIQEAHKKNYEEEFASRLDALDKLRDEKAARAEAEATVARLEKELAALKLKHSKDKRSRQPDQQELGRMATGLLDPGTTGASYQGRLNKVESSTSGYNHDQSDADLRGGAQGISAGVGGVGGGHDWNSGVGADHNELDNTSHGMSGISSEPTAFDKSQQSGIGLGATSEDYDDRFSGTKGGHNSYHNKSKNIKTKPSFGSRVMGIVKQKIGQAKKDSAMEEEEGTKKKEGFRGALSSDGQNNY